MTTAVRKLDIVPPAPRPSLARGNLAALDERTRALRAAHRVALVSMPFQSARTPSIQIGLLAAVVESHGFAAQTFHLALELARRVDFAVYEELCQMRGRMTGDWLFSVAAFGGDAPDAAARFVDDFAADVPVQFGDATPSPESARRHRLAMLRVRDEIVPAYLDAMMREIDWSRFSVVGFSSVFQQTVASIALARRIKEAHPHVRTVFGGSNFEEEMGLELSRKVRWIDHAVLGEGDEALPELLIALSEARPTDGIGNVATRTRDGEVVFGGPRPLLEDLDALPLPSYGEYFQRAEATGLIAPSRRRPTRLPFESARGCWWGQKHHCTFCGLNANGMRFRSKSPGVVADELAALARAHGTFSFNAVDNIVEPDYLKSLFPRIVDEERDYRIFYEVKSNLSRAEVKALRTAGVTSIQPGIESLSTHVLKLMRKGVTAAQNVNLLRWATYYGVQVGWNVLWGFPGETVDDYVDQARLVAQLTHLVPPSLGGVRILMERFSPLFFDRESFPVELMRAEPSYAYVYPRTIDLDKVAYFFEYKLRDTLPNETYVELGARLRAWMDAWAGARKPTLTFFWSDDLLQIADGRGATPASFAFEGAAAALYKAACDRPVTVAKAAELARVSLPPAHL
jgi:ribosomal peptide maturation radical SAM protein 1